MKQLFVLFLLVFCFETAFSQYGMPNSNLLDDNERKDGFWVEHYSECHDHYHYYRHGVEHGVAWGYNPCKSTLIYFGEFNNGEMSGTWLWFDDNNRLLWKFFDFKDTTTLIPIVHKFAVKYAPHNCYCIDYHSNGRIKSEGRWFFFTSPEMDDTGEYGMWQYYNEDGCLVETKFFE